MATPKKTTTKKTAAATTTTKTATPTATATATTTTVTKTITLADHLASIPAGVRPIIKAARDTVRAVAPEAKEIACQSQKPKSKSMMWKLARYAAANDEVVVTIGTFTSHASMFFARGADLEDADEDGLLEGKGDALRYITLRTPSDAQGKYVEALVRQAFALATS